MAFEMNDMNGSLFKSDATQKRDYNGSCKVNGVEMWISAWVKTGTSGVQYFSMAFEPKQQQAPPQQQYQQQAPPQQYQQQPQGQPQNQQAPMTDNYPPQGQRTQAPMAPAPPYGSIVQPQGNQAPQQQAPQQNDGGYGIDPNSEIPFNYCE